MVCNGNNKMCVELVLLARRWSRVRAIETRALPRVPRDDTTNSAQDRARLVTSSRVENTGQYADIRDVLTDSDHYNYIDIDQVTDQPDSGYQNVPPHGYEGLDLAVLRPPQGPQDYVRLGADGSQAADVRDTTERVEMNEFDDNHGQNRVSSF